MACALFLPLEGRFGRIAAWFAISLYFGGTLAAEVSAPDFSDATFQRRVQNRSRLDRYPSSHYLTTVQLEPDPIKPVRRRSQERKGVLVEIRPVPASETTSLGLDLPNEFEGTRSWVPPVGYRALLAGQAHPPSDGSAQPFDPAYGLKVRNELRASLVKVGLLRTLARSVHQVFAREPGMDPGAIERQLLVQGFPLDLLRFFPREGEAGNEMAKPWIAFLTLQFQRRISPESLDEALLKTAFRFKPSKSEFTLVCEADPPELEALRLQIAGGYRKDGMVPGGDLEFVARLVKALPDVKIVASIENKFFDFAREIAVWSWDLRRQKQLTLIGENLPLSPWARDNATVGMLNPGSGSRGPAMLLSPRYASVGENDSRWLPGDSQLMNGLSAAGLLITQSSLLYQGGNLMAVKSPRTGRRILFAGEAEVHRNVALGFSWEQALEALRLEMGAEECIPFPAGSYHLDYDVTFRRQGDRWLAFLNDASAAAVYIANLGIQALEERKVISMGEAYTLRTALQSGSGARLRASLDAVLESSKDKDGQYVQLVAQAFVKSPSDSATANFQCFLIAVDWLEAEDLPEFTVHSETTRGQYLEALADLQLQLRHQRRLLEREGFTTVMVPSMPDLYVAPNSINGQHLPSRFLMPAWGGFYEGLDQVASSVFRRELGKSIEVVPLVCSHLQRHHGGVHCLVSFIPAVGPAILPGP